MTRKSADVTDRVQRTIPESGFSPGFCDFCMYSGWAVPTSQRPPGTHQQLNKLGLCLLKRRRTHTVGNGGASQEDSVTLITGFGFVLVIWESF